MAFVFRDAAASPGRQKSADRSYKQVYQSYDEFLGKVPSVRTLGEQTLDRNTLVREKMSRLAPTQSEYGKSLIEANRVRQLDKAKKNHKTPHEWVQRRAIGFAIPTVIGPENRVLVLDSHHGILTNIKLLEGTDYDSYLMFKIIHDFRNASEEEFVQGVFGSLEAGGMGKGQFLRKHESDALEKKVSSLPKTFSAMVDNPHRSIMGGALSTFGVQPDNLKDYVEFKLINHMLDLDLMPKTDFGFNEHNIRAYAKVLYTEPVLSFLRSMLRKPEEQRVFDAQLEHAARQISAM